jgi:hypothetical protein
VPVAAISDRARALAGELRGQLMTLEPDGRMRLWDAASQRYVLLLERGEFVEAEQLRREFPFWAPADACGASS